MLIVSFILLLYFVEMVERFQISVFIMIIGFRNILEISGGGLHWDYVLEGIIVPLLVTFLSEIIVDWLKHSFITKFNGIVPDVYPTFIDILCKDYARASSGKMNVSKPLFYRGTVSHVCSIYS